MNDQLMAITTHHWLKHPAESTFHVYQTVRIGTESMCGKGKRIQKFAEMDIPGDRSVCCLNCYSVLYGINTDAIMERKE